MHKIKLLIILILFLGVGTIAECQYNEMDRFLDSLMEKMTLYEKLGQTNLSYGVGNIPVVAGGEAMSELIRKGLIGSSASLEDQKIAVTESRLGIPLISGRDIIHGCHTTFPIPLAMSCMWDMGRVEQSARIAAEEASTIGICWTYSPMVDICRDPRWGRIAEGFGEDPWYGSLMARAFVRGYQSDDLSRNNTLMACVKHFALYGASEAGRDYNTVDMSRLSMYQDFLPPYRAAVEEGVGSVMSSFNLVDGIPSSGNKWLMNDLLRGEWGFDGFVVTDFTAINEMINHGMGNISEMAVLALKAGVDMDMVGQSYIETLEQSLKEGRVSQEEIDQACRRILEAKYKLGLFEHPYQYFDEKRFKKVVLSPAHKKASREAAQRSMVLLKNDEILPLKKQGTIALVGPLAKVKEDLHGTWAFTDDTTEVISVYEGIRNALGRKGKLLYAKGSEFTEDPYLLNAYRMYTPDSIVIDPEQSDQLLREAVDIASKSDIIIAALGEPRAWSGEASSRSDISIPDCQKRLLESLLATGKPVVLVLINGRPLTLQWEDANVPAILEAWHCGIETGNAVADILFGAYNPSGKLTVSFPRTVGQIPVYYNHKPTGRPYNPDDSFTSRYLDLPNSPLYPFGYGLSYTSFGYSEIELNKTVLSSNDTLFASVVVTNTGQRAGEETVQMYINDPAAKVSRPVKELKGFRKIYLEPGQQQKVTFPVTTNDLMFFDSNLDYIWQEGEFNIYIGAHSGHCFNEKVTWLSK